MGTAALLATTVVYSPAALAVSVVSNPSTPNEFSAKIRWGNSGYEAGIRDNGTDTPTLNPPGTPVWNTAGNLGNPHNFEVFWDSSAGSLTLSVDFDRNNSFGVGETISRSLFSAAAGGSGLNLANYTGFAFNYLSIAGHESGSTARSNISNLVINGTPLPGLAPVGTFMETYYGGTNNPTGDITIAGQLTFTTVGTTDERPAWTFNFKGPVTPVPEPGAYALMLAGMGVVGFAARRRRVR